MSRDGWVPAEVPLDRPSAARIYDYMLGGYHNFEIDRAIGDKMIAVYPEVRLGAQANRAFLRRAIRFIAEQGVDQFLDLGSGIPTVGNVHEVAQAINPDVRVAYVDIDPVAVAHSRTMLADNPRAVAIQADVHQPEAILNHSEIQDLLDFERPLGLLCVAIMHYILDDEEACEIVRAFRSVMVPGSHMALAQGATGYNPPQRREMVALFGQAASTKTRSPETISLFFEGFDLVEPGLVYVPLWHPEGQDDIFVDQPEHSLTLGGVGRKP